MDDIGVEIGSGNLPTIEALRQDLQTTESLSLDLNSKRLEDLSEKMGYMKVRANAAKLPMADESLKLIYAKDVLGDPKIPNKTISRIISEMARVVTKDGNVVIFETGSPPDIIRLITQFAENGLKVVERNEGDNSGKVFAYGDRFGEHSYSLVLKRTAV